MFAEIQSNNGPHDGSLRALIVTKMLRADRLVPAAQRFVSDVFGEDIFGASGDLNELIAQAGPSTPIALCCSPGFDASFKVENAVESGQVRCSYIAMGSSEGVGSADKAISEAAATGNWVFVKNVHLALAWLQGMEKRLDSIKPHMDFRLFLSMESTPKIPVNLIRICRVLMCEQPAGIRANIKDSLVPSAPSAKAPPVERARLYLLLSILHGVIQERLRYAPTLGWSSIWEFNDSDFDCAAHVIDVWIDKTSHSRSNIAPANIPWAMIRTLMWQVCYGGKIDHDGDAASLAALIDRVIAVINSYCPRRLIGVSSSAGSMTSPNASRPVTSGCRTMQKSCY